MSAKRRRRQWARMGTRGRRGSQRIDNGFLEVISAAFDDANRAIDQQIKMQMIAIPVDMEPRMGSSLCKPIWWPDGEGDS